ncbi:efflux RND transporter periplasmic adaptor subunit [Rhizobium sp. SSA_523]|uniref:efflux RND transporter periplasmic adaptor subunit n=1 Tax=Rhizobium sp. SSA_523 TaxID=2952477 RepID=UPI0020903AC3|nr:efflux RND transporter periplasmic adaptor subunit [Rhizobium sp. SSA_523]MCO5730269.1 efflux RND transporter periplasmic adaptor subunit [Rhizobium sp. SSA_523]WKC25324.1 efflux RND transporter periplasmic adaptor subunit [Rhizobium sp. SSA_523]
MRIWKQVLLSLAVLLVGACLWLFLRPDTASSFVSLGVPEPLVALIAPQQAENARAGEAAGGAGSAANGRSGSAGEGSGQAGRQAGGQGNGQGNSQGSGGGQGGRATTVVAEAVEAGTVNDRLAAIGDGRAIQTVVVMPQSTGTISEILVSSGQRVKTGDLLARLDNDEQLIERDKARVALNSARERSQSYKNLRSVARLDVLDAQIAEQSAELALATAELNLKRRDIVAPIDGVAGIVAVNVGDNVTTQTSIVTLDDRSQILVDFWAPERFVTQLKPGLAVEASSVSRPGQSFSGEIDSIDNRVDSASRTIRVRAKIENGEDLLRAGMSFAVSLRFAGDDFPAVDPLAVQWDAEGAYVWKVTGGTAEKVRVRIIQRNPDRVLVDAELTPEDKVVTEGLQRVREGQPVQIQGEANPKVAEAKQT